MAKTFADIFEIGMVICFGFSWPFNVIRSYKARTAKGTSLLFTLLIVIGYVSAIIGKFILIGSEGAEFWTVTRTIAFIFYWINLAMVSTGLVIYFRNKKLDADAAKRAEIKEENKAE